MNDKEIRQIVLNVLNMYAYTVAASSADVKNVSDLKINKQDIKNELVYLHYRMVDKSSVLHSQYHSSKMFKVYYDDIKKEHKKNSHE